MKKLPFQPAIGGVISAWAASGASISGRGVGGGNGAASAAPGGGGGGGASALGAAPSGALPATGAGGGCGGPGGGTAGAGGAMAMAQGSLTVMPNSADMAILMRRAPLSRVGILSSSTGLSLSTPARGSQRPRAGLLQLAIPSRRATA